MYMYADILIFYILPQTRSFMYINIRIEYIIGNDHHLQEELAYFKNVYEFS